MCGRVVHGPHHREARSLQGAARLLNARGVVTRHGKPWRESTVRMMLRRQAPELLPATKGARPAARTYLASGLLVCPHDGTVLSGKARAGRWIAYQCRRGAEMDHPSPHSVPERAILPWLMAEAARLRVPGELAVGDDADDERAAIEARIARVGDRYEVGEITKAEWLVKVAALRDEAERIERRQVVGIIPPALDWTWPVGNVNAVLRSLWDHVELGRDLRPVRAEWIVPEWRRG